MPVRGIRGAITVKENKKADILSATKELLTEIVKSNQIDISEIASVIFSVTIDLNAEFPAAAAREIGWKDTPLLCTREIDVPKSLPRCIRVLLHVNSDKAQKDMKHVYLKEAVKLRG
jgi:chorismate mutase